MLKSSHLPSTIKLRYPFDKAKPKIISETEISLQDYLSYPLSYKDVINKFHSSGDLSLSDEVESKKTLAHLVSQRTSILRLMLDEVTKEFKYLDEKVNQIGSDLTTLLVGFFDAPLSKNQVSEKLETIKQKIGELEKYNTETSPEVVKVTNAMLLASRTSDESVQGIIDSELKQAIEVCIEKQKTRTHAQALNSIIIENLVERYKSLTATVDKINRVHKACDFYHKSPASDGEKRAHAFFQLKTEVKQPAKIQRSNSSGL